MLTNAVPAIIAIALCLAGAAVAWLAPSAQIIVLAILAALALAIAGVWAITRRAEQTSDDGLGQGLASAMVVTAVALFVGALLATRAVIWLAQPLIG